MADNTDSIVFDERECPGGRRVAFARLNAEKALNSLSKTMIDALQPQMERWAARDDIACVVLYGSGERAFCAGGDVIGLYQAMKDADGAPSPTAEAFFAAEYRLDHTIHRFPKPVLCWGHGIVMGGGLGLMAGASHRVVTKASRIAMPEVTIGLFPDVGARWFLGRMPAGIGRFLGLTTTPMNAGDALWLNMGDYLLCSEDREPVFDALTGLRWTGVRAADDAALADCLRDFGDAQALQTACAESPLFAHQSAIAGIAAAPDVASFIERLQAAAEHAALFEHGVRAVAGASPLSMAVVHRQLDGDPRMSIEQVLQADYAMAVACTRRPDLAEGIRALLVDKDKQPAWQPAELADVQADDIDAHFRLPSDYNGRHPLGDLNHDGRP
ncbi:enoyl-CoA hydratase/isomerase family protein [Salinisphaera sp. T31B1]|uniref:enoyl-CoA hydratase/isomerase family protein n=1 Tax=Salinisphaera sp. T31B1 TaxID=727963 RepID=UPI003341F1E7